MRAIQRRRAGWRPRWRQIRCRSLVAAQTGRWAPKTSHTPSKAPGSRPSPPRASGERGLPSLERHGASDSSQRLLPVCGEDGSSPGPFEGPIPAPAGTLQLGSDLPLPLPLFGFPLRPITWRHCGRNGRSYPSQQSSLDTSLASAHQSQHTAQFRQ